MMKSPFTLRRYVIGSIAVTLVFALLGVVYWLKRFNDPAWLLVALAPMAGFGCCFSIWLSGEIGWRGSRSTRLRSIPKRTILARLAVGIAVVILSACIPETWVSVNILEGVGTIALLVIIYAIGQLYGIRMKKRETEHPNGTYFRKSNTTS